MNGMLVGLKKESKNQKPSSRASQSFRPGSDQNADCDPPAMISTLNF